MNTLQKSSELAGRVLLSLLFIGAGVSKLGAYAATAGYMQAMHVPTTLLPLVIALEIGGGLAILLGLFTRVASVLLAGFCVIAAAIFHSNFADQIQMVMFLKNLSIAGAFLILFARGAGPYSIDARRGR
jgi:putative oxidoreductase